MNKYNIGDTVYYVEVDGIRKGKIDIVSTAIKGVYILEDGWTVNEDLIYPTVDELIEWLKTTVK